ncbi:MAG: helix-hairpin-helix domain-containing protein [Nocardioidaceae bacterium]
MAVLALAAGWKLLRPATGVHGSAPPAVRVSGGAAGESGAHGREAGVYVHVAGAVRRPGLYRLPGAARIAAALERAGGPTRRAQLDAVNLAARVEDGQQIVVPRAGAAPLAGAVTAPGTSGAGASTSAAGAPAGAAGSGASGGVQLSLSTATVEQLDAIDGIGPTLAQRIIAYRDQHGGFRSLDELKEVDGIGDKRFAALRGSVRP